MNKGDVALPLMIDVGRIFPGRHAGIASTFKPSARTSRDLG
jgi:hypothetical protein